MKKIISIVLLFTVHCSLFTAFAQKPETPAIKKRNIDSLLFALVKYPANASKQNDTTRVNIYFNLIKRADVDSAKHYAKEAMKICNDYSELVANSEKKFADNFKQEIKNDPFLGFYLRAKARLFRIKGNNEINNEKKLEYYLSSLKLCEKIGDKEGLAASYLGISDVYVGQSNFDKAIENIQSAQKIHNDIGDKINYADTYYVLGTVYYQQKQYDKTLKNYTIALKLSKESGSLYQTGLYYGIIGNFYVEREEYERALVNHIASLKISQQLKDIKGIADSYQNVGSIYYNMKDYDKALESNKAALKKYQEFGNPNLIADSYKKVAEAYSKLNKYNNALDNLYYSLETYKKLKERQGMAESFILLSEVYSYKKDYAKAVDYLKKAVDIYKETKDLELIKNAYKKLAAIYSMQSDYKIAYQYHQLYTDMMDSIKNQSDETIKQIQTIQSKFDKEKKEQEKQLEEAKLKQEKTFRYALYIGIALLLVFGGFMFNRYRITKKQKGIIESQKHVVEEKNLQITKSIQYALKIQTAILPSQRIIKQEFKNSFVLYKPKDIVAGDFYWMEQVGDIILFAACDCTGHGVPGAMVSVVCYNALNRAVREFGLTQPNLILDKTTELVAENFSKSEENIKDGMDVSLCSFNFSKTSHIGTIDIQWAGANNPLWILQNGEYIEIKADKQSVSNDEHHKPFNNQHLVLRRGDSIYLFSDGYADQFGRPEKSGGLIKESEEGKEKKLTRKRFKELILSLQELPMEVQGIALNKFIEDFRSDIEQIDDILVMGVKL